MRTEFVYSFMALGAIPVVVNAADVQAIQINADVLTSTDGSKVTYAAGKLLPGSYTFTAQLTSKVYGVEAKIGGKTQKFENGSAAAQNINIQFTLNAEADVELTLESTDPGESGAGFTVANPLLSLSFDFTAVKTALANNAQTLADAIAAYNYAAKQEDVDAAKALKTKANGVAETYADYKKYKFYATKSTIQEEIDALADKAAAAEAAYQNEQAYNRVNTVITAIKSNYNTAVAELEQTLVGAAAYLIDGAKADLNENINVKITEATQQSYASYQAGTAVADEAANTANVPTEGALNAIVKNWKDQATANIAAYNALHAKVTALQADLDAIAPNAAIASQFDAEKAEAQAAIDAVNNKVEGAKNTAAQLTLSVATEETAAQTKINTLAGKVNTANAEYTAWQAAIATIGTLQTNLNNAKTMVNAKVSADGNYKAQDYYDAYVAGVQSEIDAFTTAANKAYNTTHNAVAYNTDLDVTATQAKIDVYKANAVDAVVKYDDLQTAIKAYQDSLNVARAEVEGLAIYEDANYDYKTQLDLIQKRINNIKKAITAAEGKKGDEHWTDMLAIDADAAIAVDIQDLRDSKQADQNQYDKDFLDNGIDDLDTRIAAFNTTYATGGNTKLGADYAVFAQAENAIEAKKDAIEAEKAAVDPVAADAAATIQALGIRITELQAEQAVLEGVAAEIAAKVAANGSARTTLAASIDGLQTKIGTFKTTYKIGQDDSTLGNRGKSGGSVATEVNEIETALNTLEGKNDAVVVTAVAEVEKFETAVAGLTISDLENGVYDVKYKIGDDAEQTLNNVLVTEGTLTINAVVPEGKTASITRLTYHENAQTEKYAGDGTTENPGYNAAYSALAAQENALETAAPGIKTAVDANAAAYTAAQTALTAAQTEYDKLKDAKLTDANGDLASGKARMGDPSGWWMYKSNMPEGMNTYVQDKAIVTDALTAMTNGINTANTGEDMVQWNADNLDKYSSVIADSVAIILDRMQFESDNYYGYRHLRSSGKNDVGTKQKINDSNFTTSFNNASNNLATVAGAGAEPYYTGVIDGYSSDLTAIRNRMYASLYARTAVADQPGYITELKALKALVDKVQTNAAANLAKYNEQTTAAEETQTLWNSVYTEIAATDQSSKVQDWLDELDAIQVTLTAAKTAVETNYANGEAVAKAVDFTAIKAAVNDVKARQNASYNEYVAADNKAAHEAFMGSETTKGAIQLVTEAYQKAVKERAQYSVSNEAIKAAVDAAAQTLDAALYDCPDQIQTLTAQENAAYEAVVSPAVFDVDPYITQANTIKANITAALNDFKTAVTAAIQDYWNDETATYAGKVSAAEAAIADYSTEAKTNAFKDVKDLIAEGSAAVTAMELTNVESKLEALENIDAMLAADKDAAAAKDVTPRITAAESKYTEVKTYINGVSNDIAAKAAELENLENAYEAIADEKALDKTFANRNTIKAALDAFVAAATTCKTNVENAVAADNANTAAYGDMTAAISPVEAKLAEAKAKAAGYKYVTSFATDEATLADIKTDADGYKAAGSAVANKAAVLADVATLSNAIEATLTAAFGTEKTGLCSDITELKNQYNAYVAANELNATATAFKAAIDDLEAQLGTIAIADLDTPADGIQYDEIVAATDALIKLQGDIADKQTELLAANASGDNAAVLADFNSQLADLAAAATLEGTDAWVAQQTVGGKTIAEAISEMAAQIAEVKAAVEAETNIAFYKNQYQAQIDALKADLVPVTAAIAAKQAQVEADAAAYADLVSTIEELEAKATAAIEKIGAYEYRSNYVANEQTELDALAEIREVVETNHENKVSQYNTNPVSLSNYTIASIAKYIQLYLDRAAYYELSDQRDNLYTLLVNAIDNKYQAQKFSNALWARLTAEEAEISGGIDALEYPIWNSYQLYESTAKSVWVYDEHDNRIAKERTSDADYAGQMAAINAIKAEIADLSEAVDNLNLLGDANVDGKVNVLDYQKVLNMILDPTLQPEEGSDLFVNTDINGSEVIEVGDLTAIVNYILTGDWGTYAAARAMDAQGENIAMTMADNGQCKQRISVALDNVNDYTAFQLDVVLPNGMKMVDTSLSSRAGESHRLYSRAQMDGSIRVLASSVKGETFSGNEGAVLYIDVETTGEYMGGKAELLNILFADTNAQTRSFTIGGDATGIDTVGTFEALKQKVYDLGGRVKSGLKKGIGIIRTENGTTKKVVK